MILSRRLSHRLALGAALAAAASSPCFGLAEFGRGLLLLRTNASASYDSYFIGTVTNDPDTIYTLYPSLEFTRQAGRAKLATSAGVAFNRHEKNKGLDSEDLRLSGTITMPTAEGARLQGSFGVGYNEATTIDYFLNDRVASETFNTNLSFEYLLNSRMTLREALSYTYAKRDAFNTTETLIDPATGLPRNDQVTGQPILFQDYSDQTLLANQIGFTYKNFLRDASLVANHNFSRTASSGDNDLGIELDQFSNSVSVGLEKPLSTDVTGRLSVGYSVISSSASESFSRDQDEGSAFIELGIDGPFLPRNRFPKLKSSASLSYQQAQTAGLGDTAGRFLAGNFRLAWEARERTQLYVQGSRSIDLTAGDRTIERTQFSGGFSQQVGYSIGINGSVGYSVNQFRGVDRQDNLFDATLGVGKSFNKYLSIGANYNYQQVDNSGQDVIRTRFVGRDYTRHVATASATVTF